MNLYTETPVFLALGIAFQLAGDFARAADALEAAIDLDPDYVLAYNSLALTQHRAGAHEEALDTYDAGARALARGIAKAMRNDPGAPILEARDTRGTLWVSYAAHAAAHLAVEVDGVQNIASPTGRYAEEEARTRRHGGLYWKDGVGDDGATTRLFLPNFFDTFQHALRSDPTYANLIGNRGTVLESLGRHDEAHQHFEEATEFLPDAGSLDAG